MIKILSAESFGIDVNLIECEVSFEPSRDINIYLMGISSRYKMDFKKKFMSICNTNNINIYSGNYVINLLPIDLPKNSANFDLPIFITLLLRLKLIPKHMQDFLNKSIIVGEIGLNGYIYPVKNSISIALNTKHRLIIPKQNVSECNMIDRENIYYISHISDLFGEELPKVVYSRNNSTNSRDEELDINDVIGNSAAKRGLTLSAAGRHNLLFYGPPGSGKTMLSRRLTSIMADLTRSQIIETTRIHSAAGILKDGNPVTQIPFRNPHHSISISGLIGGGTIITPGEISLAHNGVLFLDEFLEFNHKCIDSLRQSMEDGFVNIKKGNYNARFPASFILLAALNPCPCGYFGDKQKCTCTHYQIKNYLKKLSGPILDRIDMQILLMPVDKSEIIHNKNDGMTSKEILERVKIAQKRQFKRNDNIYNSEVAAQNLNKLFNVSTDALEYLSDYYKTFDLSLRSFHKILKLSRTIADLEDLESVNLNHISEAISYRTFDKFLRKFNVSI